VSRWDGASANVLSELVLDSAFVQSILENYTFSVPLASQYSHGNGSLYKSKRG
jgi:hypothetical protein